MAEVSAEGPLEKVSISGPILASLMQRVASCNGDCDGLLFGHIRHLSAPKIHDDDDDSVGPTTCVALVAGYVCSGSPQSFYDASGQLRLPVLNRFLSQQRVEPPEPDTGTSSLIGWFVGRRNTHLRPSMREVAVSSSLFNSCKSLGSSDQPGPPRVFLLLSDSVTLHSTIHTHEYRAFEFLPRGVLVAKSVDIVNVGPGFRGNYDVFCPISSFSSLSLDQEDCKGNQSRSSGKNVSEGLEPVTSRLIGADSAKYTADLEDLYKRMLSKLQSLARRVEASNAKLLDQEKKNLKLRSRSAGLD